MAPSAPEDWDAAGGCTAEGPDDGPEVSVARVVSGTEVMGEPPAEVGPTGPQMVSVTVTVTTS